MNQLDERGLRDHVTLLGWLYIAGNLLLLMVGGVTFLLLSGIGLAVGEREVFGILTIVGIFVAGLMLLLALPGIVAGVGLLRRRNWGRILALLVAFFSLANVPIGTIIGLYAFWVLLQDAAPAFFGQGQRQE